MRIGVIYGEESHTGNNYNRRGVLQEEVTNGEDLKWKEFAHRRCTQGRVTDREGASYHMYM